MAITNTLGTSNSGSATYTGGSPGNPGPTVESSVTVVLTINQSVSVNSLVVLMMSNSLGGVRGAARSPGFAPFIQISGQATGNYFNEIVNLTESSSLMSSYVGALIMPFTGTISTITIPLTGPGTNGSTSYGWGLYVFTPQNNEQLNLDPFVQTAQSNLLSASPVWASSTKNLNLTSTLTVSSSNIYTTSSITPRKTGVVLGVLAINGPRTDSWVSDTDTAGGSWVTTQGTSGTGVALANGTTGSGSSSFRAQYKLSTGVATQTWNGSLGTARAQVVSIINFEYGAVGYWTATSFQNSA